jgi:Holliday junction resolvasome RuvABC endonuclease subunit
MIEVRGVDPSLRATGVCLPDGSTVTIKTGQADKGDSRLTILRKAFTFQVMKWPAELNVIELPGHFQTQSSAIAAGMALGIIREVLADAGEPVAFVAPALLKQFATGRGNAEKTDMVAAANEARGRYAVAPVCDLTSDDEADAWWLWQMGRWRLDCADVPEIWRYPKNKPAEGIRELAVNGGGAKWPVGAR